MEQTHSTTAQTPRSAAATDTQITWNLLKLALSLFLGALMVWLLIVSGAISH